MRKHPYRHDTLSNSARPTRATPIQAIMSIATASDSFVATTADPIKFLLNDLNLGGVTRRLETKHPTLDIQPLVKEYRRFLVLKYAHRDEHAKLVSPSPLIDQVWHEHVLDTQSYIPMCLAIGLWIHHDPDGASDHDAANRARRRENTVDLYTARFGPMDQDVWDMNGVRRPYLRGKGPSQGHSESRRKRKAESIELALGKGNAAASAGVHDAIGSATKKQRQLTRCSIRFRDQTGSEVEFRVSRTTTFAHIANGYADIKKQPVEDFWFTYDGSRLRQHDEATLEDLDLQDGDVIDVGLLQIGC